MNWGNVMIENAVAGKAGQRWLTVAGLALVAAAVATPGAALGASPGKPAAVKPEFSEAVAFDVSPPLRSLSASTPLRLPPGTVTQAGADTEPVEVRPELGPEVKDSGHSGDGALNGAASSRLAAAVAATISPPLLTFEGISNQDNFNLFGFRVNPPDPVGAVGPNHYVQMANLAYAVFDKQGNLLLGTRRHRHAVGRLCGSGLHRSVRRPDRGLRQARGPLDPDPVHNALYCRPPTTSSTTALRSR